MDKEVRIIEPKVGTKPPIIKQVKTKETVVEETNV
jgi:hypothetical protein